MNKKLIAACMVIAAFAVVPSLASARPVLTEPTGTTLAAGTKITATNVGNTKMTISGLPTVECSTAILTGTLHTNAAGKGAEGNITSAIFGGTSTSNGGTIAGDPEPECTGGLGPAGVTAGSLPWCLEATEPSDTFTIRGGECTKASTAINFVLSTTFLGATLKCEYTRPTSIPGTLVTDTTGQDATGSISEVVFTRAAGVSETCPKEGKLDMTFTLETDEATAKPLFISNG